MKELGLFSLNKGRERKILLVVSKCFKVCLPREHVPHACCYDQMQWFQISIRELHLRCQEELSNNMSSETEIDWVG